MHIISILSITTVNTLDDFAYPISNIIIDSGWQMTMKDQTESYTTIEDVAGM